ncbi:Ig-like domain-containing protein [Gryllotalpicola ginsengisoli]|uniref:Ig-like domain-containing protein n=1 Tax=Gryllotalpicola ginsengisoli TaxID=444608 RepID=UPI0003B2EF26|nr:Ig-like domain-containing protein [Gryllotalpicola ginsengisoli]
MPAQQTRARDVLTSTWFKVVAAVVAVAALVTGAVVAQGYDVKQTPVDDTTVWALKSSANSYARVNTALDELDTVKTAAGASNVVQTAGHVLLYAQNYAKVASVSQSQPADLAADSDSFAETPSGTTEVVHAGDFVGYLTADGKVSVAQVSDGAKAQRASVPPAGYSSGSKRAYSADAIAVSPDGTLFSFSRSEHSVLRYDIRSGRVTGTDAVSGGPTKPGSTLTAVGDDWALLSPDHASLWIAGHKGAIDTGLGREAVLQQSSDAQQVVLAADHSGLVAFDLTSGKKTTLLGGGDDLGTPAAPAWQDNRAFAAWLPTSGQGTLWSGKANLDGAPKGASHALSYSGKSLGGDPDPEFVSNGSHLILNELDQGWVWTMPDGTLVPSSQNWSLLDQQTQDNAVSTQQRTTVTDPQPPVAENDSFGVRPGALVTLPVLLNDHDPNDDVLSIVPDSVKGLDPAFGTVHVAGGGQLLTVDVSADAPDSATFTYNISDGTTADGRKAEHPATVHLSLHSSGDAAPVWCGGDAKCAEVQKDKWPTPELPRGGTVTASVLPQWVDPDGDAMFATATADDGLAVSVNSSGTATIQAEPNAATGRHTVRVTVSDVQGKTAERDLTVTVTGSPTLTVENFGLMTAENVPITVDPSSHISGAVGTPTITAATPSDRTDAKASIDSSGTSFEFSATKAGSYSVAMTVTDDRKAPATATVRITVVKAGQKLLSTTPVTVFVRPQMDTSVDVFQAVQNPTGAVLLLSDPEPKPADGASLDVDVVGQSQLRVRGTTGDEQPGLLGTVRYKVSDGTGNSAMEAVGIATVYLLAASQPAAPITIDDTVTARAGAQVDIPVLANDVGPDGNVVELDPTSIRVPKGGGLGFASGQTLRYLAPSKAGTLVLRYSAYSAGSPNLSAQAEVHVRVLAAGGDRPPQPTTLTGRVVAGSTVRIPFSGYGVDPDGDSVSLERIVDQPDEGTAQIAADGSAILYSSVAGTKGPVSFSYEVRDSNGETARALVRVGVLDAQSDPAPVTFSDYVQVQAGAKNKVEVHPIANDLDPAGGTLTLSSVVPTAQKGSAEYRELKSHLSSASDGTVVITAPDRVGTMTYTYSVKNQQGDVGAGLIVVKVVSAHVPDYPVVTDTVVSAQDRDRLSDGIDVVAGKVSWGGGDVDALKLSLWGDPSGVTVSGDELKVASVPDGGLLVPFELTGRDFSGASVKTYGFLRVPALDDLILALKSDAQPVQVKEGDSATFDMTKLVTVPRGQRLIVQSDAVAASGTRKNASCTAVNAQITYAAGRGSPWTDTCEVPVKLFGQDRYTVLAVPIVITPLKPEPSLRPASLTVSPGQPALSYDLADMTTWSGAGEHPQLRYTVTPHGSLFDVSLGADGHTLSVRAKDTASPGLEQTVTVSLVGYSVPSGVITLKVGPAPSTLPRGGSVAKTCSEASGGSCSIRVIGAPGEVNAYANTPLKLAGVSSTAAGCEGVTFKAADASTVTASWKDSAPGGTCTVPFQVTDAQGRRSAAGSGDGSIAFSLQGFPSAPAAVVQTGYTGDSVTLTVTPGDAASAFPALEGFHVYVGGKRVGSCTAAGVCEAIGGRQNGQKQTYTVRAFNAVGESKGAATTDAWAYRTPDVGSLDTDPVYVDQTSQSTGFFNLSITNTDDSTASYQVTVGGQPAQTITASSGAKTTKQLSAPAGTPTSVTVTPQSKYSLPPGDAPAPQSASTTVVTAGTPGVSWSTLPAKTSTTDSSITVLGSPVVDKNGSTEQGEIVYVATDPGASPGCAFYPGNADPLAHGGDASSSSQTISGLQPFSRYDVWACYTNQYGVAQQKLNDDPVLVWDQSNAPTPTGCSYSITQQGDGLPDYEFGQGAPDCTSGTIESGYRLTFDGYDASAYGETEQITAEYCALGQYCGKQVTVSNSGSAKFQMRVDSVAAQCTTTDGQTTLGMTLQGEGTDAAGASIKPVTYSYTAADGTPHTGADASKPIPAGATNVVVTKYTITFGAGGFDSYTGGSVTPDSCEVAPAAADPGTGG